jgi:aspartate racemase
MKTLGLIGGTSWVSTVEYYRIINHEINMRLGGLNSAKMFLYSINQEERKPPSDPRGVSEAADFLTDIALRLEKAGAECLIICANTPHMLANLIQKDIHIPLIHIADVTAKAIIDKKITTVGLLGTKPTMELSFYKDRLAKFGISALTPDEKQREFINLSIFDELDKGILKDETRKKYLEIIDSLAQRGAQGIILGCTEIPLLIKQSDCNVPVFDTTELHAMAAVEFALSDEKPEV